MNNAKRVETSLVMERGYTKAYPITFDTNIPSARAVMIIATVAGNVHIRLSGGTQITIPVYVGLSIFPFEVAHVYTSGTTATAELWSLS